MVTLRDRPPRRRRTFDQSADGVARHTRRRGACWTAPRADRLPTGMWSRPSAKRIVGDGKPRVSGHIAYRAVLKPRRRAGRPVAATTCMLWGGPKKPTSCTTRCAAASSTTWSPCSTPTTTDEGWDAFGDSADLTAQRICPGQRPQVRAHAGASIERLEDVGAVRPRARADLEPRPRRPCSATPPTPCCSTSPRAPAMATEDAVVLRRRRWRPQPQRSRRRVPRTTTQARYLRTARVQIHRPHLRRASITPAGPYRASCATSCSRAARNRPGLPG
jgi:hypothetical protein